MKLNKPEQPINPYAVGNAPIIQPDHYPTLAGDKPWLPKGRFGRLAYLAWSLLATLISNIIVAPLAFLGAIGTTLSYTVIVLASIATIIFSVRRLHDMNKSGWWLVLMLLPLIMIIIAASMLSANTADLGMIPASWLMGIAILLLVIVGIYIAAVPGTPGVNRFGPPRPTATWEKVLGWLYIIVFIIGILAAIAIPAYQDYIQRTQQQTTQIAP